MEGRTELDLVQDEVDEAKRLLEEAHLEAQTAQNKVTEAACRVGQAAEEISQITESQEAWGLLDEIQQQPYVFVLSGPAVAITNVLTASEFLADESSTESVSRVF